MASCFTKFAENVGAEGIDVFCCAGRGGKVNRLVDCSDRGVFQLGRGERALLGVLGELSGALLRVSNWLMFVLTVPVVLRSGAVVVSGAVPHRNPLLCGVGAVGDMHLYRHWVLQEPHINPLDYAGSFSTKFLRANPDSKTGTSYDTQLLNISQILDHLKVISTQKTHRFLADKELDEQQIKRLADRCHDATHDSYLTNLPWQAVLGIAGYDYAGLQGVQFAAHTRVSVPDALFVLFSPWFPAQRIKVAAAIEEAKGSAKKMNDQKLFSANGMLNAYELAVRTSVQVAAARPRDKKGKIQKDSPSLVEMFAGTNPAYQIEPFHHPEFQKFRARVREVEDAELAEAEASSPSPGLSDFQHAVQPTLEKLQATLEQVVSSGYYRAHELMPNFGCINVSSSQGAGPDSSSGSSVSVPARPLRNPPASSWTLPSLRNAAPSPITSASFGSAPAASTTQVGPQSVLFIEDCQKKTQRRPRIVGVDTLKGHLHMRNLSEFENVDQLWDECVRGIDGKRGLRSIEQESKKWRDYKGGDKRWSERQPILCAVDEQISGGFSESKAIAVVQEQLDLVPKKGKSKKPNWCNFTRQLALKRKTKAGMSMKPANKSAKSAAIQPGRDAIVHFDRDNTITAALENHPAMAAVGFSAPYAL